MSSTARGTRLRARSNSRSRSQSQSISHVKAPSDLWAPVESSSWEKVIRKTVGPLLLLLVTPIFINVAALATRHPDASFLAMYEYYADRSFADLFAAAFPLPSTKLVVGLVCFVALQIVLFVCLPGRAYPGVVAPSGFRPTFRRTGPAAFCITVLLFVCGALYMNWWEMTIVFDELLPLLTLLNGSALVIAMLLLIKYVELIFA
jgi:hypothetical protein